MTATGLLLRGSSRVPEQIWEPVSWALARLVSFCPPRPVRQWQRNAEVLTGQAPDRRATSAAVASWARTMIWTTQICTWSPRELAARVLVDPQEFAELARAHRTNGAVVALPHMGSWDLAGLWACSHGLAVSTVAEQVPEFDWFVSQREALGFRVHGHRQSDLVSTLVQEVGQGRMPCLLSDRSLSGRGSEVLWHTATGPRSLRMPVGAAVVAQRSGASLFGISSHFEGDAMRLTMTPAIQVDDVDVANQRLADFFCEQASQHVADWHMLQPFFRQERTR